MNTTVEASPGVLQVERVTNNAKKKHNRKSANLNAKANRTPKLKQGDENIPPTDEKRQVVFTDSAVKNILEWKTESDGACRISHILPDINWYPDPSKYAKNSIKRDLVDQYPFSFKAMTYMLQNDFELPKLNSIQRRSLFRYPSSEEKNVILQVCPQFKSGRFNEDEKHQLNKKLTKSFNHLQYSHDGQKAFIKEMESFPSCHGGARGPTSHNLIYVKLYFACHVAGTDFLAYRLAFDIYNTIVSLWNSEHEPTMKPVKIKTENTCDEQKVNESEEGEVKGRFKTEDSCELIRCVVSHLHNKGLPIETNEIKLADIDWKQIQRQTFRTPRSMQKHFTLVVWPLLKDGTIEELQEKSWQKDVLKLLVEQNVVYIQDIDWKKIQENHFPNNTTIQLRTFISNQVQKRLKHIEELGETKPPIYDILNTVLERFLNFKFSTKPDSAVLLRQKEIINSYEDIKDSLIHHSIHKSCPEKRAVTSDKIIQNNNGNKRRTSSDTSIVKKRKIRRHTLFSEKSRDLNETFK